MPLTIIGVALNPYHKNYNRIKKIFALNQSIRDLLYGFSFKLWTEIISIAPYNFKYAGKFSIIKNPYWRSQNIFEEINHGVGWVNEHI